jgi:rRNA maturation endonuclease Nob1
MGIFSELGRRVGEFEQRARAAKEESTPDAGRRCVDCGAEFEDGGTCPDCGSTDVRAAGEGTEE